ncbi:hypothetical protein [Ruegeria sp. HU-ET01832]|uniref:hypothetical protein n=1 Tax=Ruegeria sp. HU-ET01832 TaxID=3135906 RepID=UPI00334028D4
MSLFQESLSSAIGDQKHFVAERDVLRVSGQVLNTHQDHTFSAARNLALEWVKERSGGKLPKDAWKFADFRTDVAGRNTECLAQDFDGLEVWSVRAEDPDGKVPGRNWKTEVTFAREPSSRIMFSLRLRVSSHVLDQNFTPASPRLVSSIIDELGLKLGDHSCSTTPITVRDHTSYDLFVEHLLATSRKTPLVVQSFVPNHRGINVSAICRRLAGLAHVYSISPVFARKLSDEIGKELSVFDGGVRIYTPDFEVADDPNGHRLFLRRFIQQGDNQRLVERHIAQDVAALGLRSNRIGKEVLAFSDVSARLYKYRADQKGKLLAAGRAEENDELIMSLREQVRSLEEQVTEAKELETIALEENQAYRERAEDAESRARAYTSQIQGLKASLAQNAGASSREVARPEDWPSFIGWVESTFAGQIVLTGAAKREIKKAQFTNIELACDCLSWLATDGINSRVSGADGASTREMPVAEGAIHAHCGGDAYDFDWQGQRHTADWHIKGSSSRDPKHCLRIYFAWDDQSQQIIVSHMPSHRTTSMS